MLTLFLSAAASTQYDKLDKSRLVVVARPPPPPIDPGLEKLIEEYGAERNASCKAVLPKVPTIDAADAAAFMSAYQSFKGNTSEAPVFAAAQKLLTPSLDSFLSLPSSFGDGGLDAAMVKCAVMQDAAQGAGGSPRSHTSIDLLAEFAFKGANEKALVDQLLSDTKLMKDMLVGGGASGGHYGEAMSIYTQLLNASSALRAAATLSDAMWDDRSPATVLKRLAIGTAIGLAEPLQHRFNRNSSAPTYVDPVARYLHFEKYYKAGDLDPAFPVLTTFELSHTIDADSVDEDLVWLRATMANFRPDDIAMDYHWRYAESVHTDVAYGDSTCDKFNNGTGGVCTGNFSDIPVGGDVCGGRAFWGRFACKGFGRPTWGATEHAHAAMSAWTPTGWTVLLGAPWPDCWWGNRGGEDFFLETQARENRTEFQKILRAGWVARARMEAPVPMTWHAKTYSPSNGEGGLWSALALYMKKIVVADSPAPNRTIPAAQPAGSNKIENLLARWADPPAPPVQPSIAADGTITIPSASFTTKNRSAPVKSMLSFFEGTQLLSSGCTSSVGPPCFDPQSSSVTYEIEATAAGLYFLTANFSTWHMNQDLMVSVNGANKVTIPMFYTVGRWNQTQPVQVTLVKGTNKLVFTRVSDRDVAFKEFLLYTRKPVVPPPPSNYTPAPSPPPTPASDYIEVAADTTCVKQGIFPVSEEDCGHACLALGLKMTGIRARPNMSGCFAMDSGEYKGNCNYNSNTSATCTPPCQLYGATVRALCVRK